MATVFVTHDRLEAPTMSDKIIVMSDSNIKQVCTPEEVYNKPARRFVASFPDAANCIRPRD
jgi:ABC-type Fe3+/spermidine/putrescine transport system ATPase subunit